MPKNELCYRCLPLGVCQLEGIDQSQWQCPEDKRGIDPEENQRPQEKFPTSNPLVAQRLHDSQHSRRISSGKMAVLAFPNSSELSRANKLDYRYTLLSDEARILIDNCELSLPDLLNNAGIIDVQLIDVVKSLIRIYETINDLENESAPEGNFINFCNVWLPDSCDPNKIYDFIVQAYEGWQAWKEKKEE